MNQYNTELAAAYSNPRRTEHPMARMPYETWLNTLGDVHDKHILDLGCGSGYSSRILAQNGAFVTGADKSPNMVCIAKLQERLRPLGITYLNENALTMRLHEQFEIVTPSYLLHYAKSKEEIEAFARTIYEHLVPGGRMVALHANHNPVVPFVRHCQHVCIWFEDDEPWKEGSRLLLTIYDNDCKNVCEIHFHYWTVRTYREILASVGFVDIKWVKVRMSAEAQYFLPNWKKLDKHNSSCVLVARKP